MIFLWDLSSTEDSTILTRTHNKKNIRWKNDETILLGLLVNKNDHAILMVGTLKRMVRHQTTLLDLLWIKEDRMILAEFFILPLEKKSRMILSRLDWFAPFFDFLVPGGPKGLFRLARSSCSGLSYQIVVEVISTVTPTYKDAPGAGPRKFENNLTLLPVCQYLIGFL